MSGYSAHTYSKALSNWPHEAMLVEPTYLLARARVCGAFGTTTLQTRTRKRTSTNASRVDLAGMIVLLKNQSQFYSKAFIYNPVNPSV